jgi:putative transposase
MREWQGQSHVRWYCKYLVALVPQYRRRSIYGALRREIGKVLRELCQQQGVEIVEELRCPITSTCA